LIKLSIRNKQRPYLIPFIFKEH